MRGARGGRVRKALKWTGAGLLVTLAAFVFGWVPYWMGGLATTRRFQYNDKENAGLTPASFQLAYEDVSFRGKDDVTLRGWWVPAREARGSVVLLHGLNRSRIEMVRKVPFLHEHGWNALLFDLRHHGDSGGDRSTFGWLEKDDTLAAASLARGRDAGPVVLWGVSLGAATATLAAAEDRSIAGLVADSSYLTLRDTVEHHVRLFRGFRWWTRLIPPWPLGPEVVYWIGHRGGFDPDAVDVRAAAAQLDGRPALFICNSGDRRMPPEVAHALRAAAGPRAGFLEIEGHSHGGAYRDGTKPYEAAVAALLERASQLPARASGETLGREGTERWAATTK